MATVEEMAKARADLEQAIQNFIRISRDDTEGHLFLQDWVLATACESMEPGQANFTFSNYLAAHNMAQYAVVGMFRCGERYWIQGMVKE